MKLHKSKNIALVAHDNMKPSMIEWAIFNKLTLSKCNLFATGTTGSLLEQSLDQKIVKFNSGPLGGDLQIGSRIAEGDIDILIFFWDPLESQPHDPDVKALLRIAAVWNIPVACNRSTADFLISSPLMSEAYDRKLQDFSGHNNRLNIPN